MRHDLDLILNLYEERNQNQMKYDEIIIGKMVIPLILNLSPPASFSDLYFGDDNKIFSFHL